MSLPDFHYCWTYELRASPEKLWPFVAMTVRENVAVAAMTKLINNSADMRGAKPRIKAMGTSNWRLLRMIVLQALIVGLIGYGLGVGLASLFGMLTGRTELAFRLVWQIPAATGAAASESRPVARAARVSLVMPV